MGAGGVVLKWIYSIIEYYCPKTTVGSNSCLRGMQTQKADWDPTRKQTMGSHKKTDCGIRILVSIGSVYAIKLFCIANLVFERY